MCFLLRKTFGGSCRPVGRKEQEGRRRERSRNAKALNLAPRRVQPGETSERLHLLRPLVSFWTRRQLTPLAATPENTLGTERNGAAD